MKCNGLLLFVCLCFLGACSSEEASIFHDAKDSQLESRKIVIYQAGWDEWGRASRNCKRWGLCNFVDCWAWEDDFPCIEPSVTGGGGEISETSPGVGLLTIVLDPDNDIQGEAIALSKKLFVDTDISSATDSGPYSTITVESGSYELKYDLERSEYYYLVDVSLQ